MDLPGMPGQIEESRGTPLFLLRQTAAARTGGGILHRLRIKEKKLCAGDCGI